jgi:hypothetical protein
VITKVANQEMAKQDSGDQALATEVFAVNEAGGLSGQLVAPFWKRINQP